MNNNYGFFEKRKKNKILKEISKYTYDSIPVVFKNDSDILNALALSNPSEIRNFPRSISEVMIYANPSLIVHAEEKLKKELAINDNKYIQFLSQEMIYDIVENNRRYSYISFLSDENQYKFLKTNYSSLLSEIKSFKPNVLNEFIKENTLLRNNNHDDKRIYDNFINKIKLLDLPIEQQASIISIDNSLIDKASIDAIKIYTNNNPHLIDNLPYDKSILLSQDNNEYSFLNVSHDLNNGNSLSKYGIENIKRFLSFYNEIILNKDEVSLSFKEENWAEIGRFDAKVLGVKGQYYSNVNNIKKILSLGRVYNTVLKNYYNTEDMQKYFDTTNAENYLFNIGYRNNDFENKFNQVSKIILNNTIMSKCDKRIIFEFIKNPTDNQLLYEIVKTAYGEKALSILSERKEITISEIPTFDIFDQKVFENFDIGVIHNILSYKNKSGNIIGELVRHPEKLENFKLFRELTKTYFKNTALDNEEQLKIFMDLDIEFKDKLSLNNISENEKDNLITFIIDRYKRDDVPKDALKINNIEELKNYKEIRNKMYDEAISKTNDQLVIKNIIFNKYFGMDYYRESNTFRPQKCDVVRMLRKYNVKNFINNDKTIDSDIFTKDELDILELSYIISNIQDVKVLKDLYSTLETKEDVLTPIDFKEIRSKIPGLYSNEFSKSLLTEEKIEDKINNNEPGISKTVEDGVEIITLDGTDFRIFMHTIGINNSKLRTDDGAELASKKLNEIWKTYEQGVSTISGSVIEPKLLESCSSEHSPISLGFYSFDPSIILGMGWGDIHTSHDKRLLDVYFNEYGPTLQFDYPEELVRKTAAQINNVLDTPKDIAHVYNEVAISRREINTENIKENSNGGRVLPDYIVVYGLDTNLEDAKELSRYFNKEGINLPIIRIDIEKYKQIGNSYQRAYEGYSKEISVREESPFIEEIKESIGRSV